MRIDFRFTNLDNEEKKYIRDFCITIRDNIRSEILDNSIPLKLESRKSSILNADWISWYRKPHDISMYRLMKAIVNSINISRDLRDVYTIKIEESSKIPGSRTKIERLARYLDHGNEDDKPTSFISRIFSKYRVNLNKYWKAYVSVRLLHTKTKSSIRVE